MLDPGTGSGNMTVDVASGAATDNAGNLSIVAQQISQSFYSYTLASETQNGVDTTGWKLIAPTTVNVGGTDKTFFYLDVSGDGSSNGVDYLNHNTLDTIFNGGLDTTDADRTASLFGMGQTVKSLL